MLTTLTTLTTLVKKKETMFKYPLTMKDAMRSYMNFIKSAEVKFIDPNVQRFYDDEALGLCTIQLKQLFRSQDGLPTGDSELVIRYHDPELEFQRRLES